MLLQKLHQQIRSDQWANIVLKHLSVTEQPDWYSSGNMYIFGVEPRAVLSWMLLWQTYSSDKYAGTAMWSNE